MMTMMTESDAFLFADLSVLGLHAVQADSAQHPQTSWASYRATRGEPAPRRASVGVLVAVAAAQSA
jgi:hypothetical protein